MSQFDVIIIGGGVAGLSMACALPPSRIAVIEQQALLTTAPTMPSARAYALNHFSQHLLKSFNSWSDIKFRTPYSHMKVWDQSAQINFNAREVGKSHLGHIVDEPSLRWALQQQVKARHDCQVFAKTQCASIHITHQANVSDVQNRMYTAPLLIAADGGRSWVRDQLNIPVKTWSSDHMAIVTLLTLENPHQDTAWQSFTPHGPLAFLPLPDKHQVSIVWSLPPEYGIQLARLSEADFCQAVARAMDYCCGDVLSCDARQTFPLVRQAAKNYICPHVALIGDAAHTIHPLAGLGINLGLKDVSVLAKAINRAKAHHYSWGSIPVLRRYERARRGENQIYMASLEAIKHLFCSQSKLLEQTRRMGLSFTNQFTLLKRFFIRQALG